MSTELAGTALLRVVDETPAGEILREATLMLANERITARALIERRVRAEVAQFNARARDAVFRGLVQPHAAEAQRGGFRMPQHRAVDADRQCAAALDAFATGQVRLVVGGRQLASLDDEVDVGPDVTAAFVK